MRSERDGQRAQERAMLTLSFATTSAPFASSAPTTSAWPFAEARWSGVRPSCGAGQHRGQRLPPPSSRDPAHTTTRVECPREFAYIYIYNHIGIYYVATHRWPFSTGTGDPDIRCHTQTHARTHTHTGRPVMLSLSRYGYRGRACGII